ncbi:hypothetical protein FSP39_015082 [Pinctada imbricata]|uniref:Uncharacterized protein n=1 Tax=Pinctada imbricata TaxID=66713 RepID=A0AA88Y6K5_PINIB|nr:hypothetical protein FSP39_015082 [Pinctada imbricata]
MDESVPEANNEETFEAVGNEVTIETEECETVIEEGHVTHAIIKYQDDGTTEVMEVGEEGREHIIVTSLDGDHQVVIETVGDDGDVPGNVMYVAAEEAEAEDSHVITNPPENYEEYQRPVRPVERQKMRPWLMDLLDRGNIPGLNWQNRSKRIFRISWKHAAHNCFNKDKDSDLFERWAYHTGRHHDGNHKRWKANFRCALNSLPDVIELRDLGVRKGDNAFKVYKFIDLSDKSGQEEKKRQQVINAMTLKSRGKGSKQSKSDTEVIKAEGMLQTLLHAIELKNQEASQEEGSPASIRARGALKRTLVEKSQQQAKKRRETEESEEDDAGSINSQDSSQEGIPTTPVSDSAKTEGKGPDGKAEAVITVPASLLSNLSKGISIAPAGQIPYGISTSGGQIIQLSTLLASLGQQGSPKKTPTSRLIAAKPVQKEGPVPKTVLETLKVIKSERDSANSEESQSESSPLEKKKDWTSLTAALKSTGTVKPTYSVAQTHTSESASVASASSPNVRNKLVTYLNEAGQPVKGSATIVRLSAPTRGKTMGSSTMERVIIKPSSGVNTMNSGSSTKSTGTTVVVSSPSAVVQRVEQLGDITVNIGNLDSGQPAQPVGHSVDVSTTTQSDDATEICAAVQEITEDGSQEDIFTKQITIDLGNVENQTKSEAEDGKEPSQQYVCLWCQVNFDSKADLLRHFLVLHQDMLVSEDSENIPVSLLSEGENNAEKLASTVFDALGLASSSKVKVERNRDGLFTQVIDLSQVNFSEDEVLDLSKTKEALTIGEDNKLVISELNIPPADNRPKYSLNSLIEALRNTIEQDRKDKPSIRQSLSTSFEQLVGEEGEQIFKELSSDSSDKNSDPDSDSEYQVSVKTVNIDGKTMYKCDKCNKTFSKSCTFARHAMIHAKLYPYRCGICNLKYKDMRVLLKHLDWHGENLDCPCKKCENSENEGSKDSEVNKVCHFQCDICGKSFVSDEVCKTHVNIMHSQGSSMKCETCDMKFTCYRMLSKHRKSAHSVQFCPYCYESCTDLASHFKKHEGAYLYRCGLCSSGFNSRPHLHDHLKVHTLLGKVSEEGTSSTVKQVVKAKNINKQLKAGALDLGPASSEQEKSITLKASDFLNKKLQDKIIVETFDKDKTGKTITKSLVIDNCQTGVEEDPGMTSEEVIMEEVIQETPTGDTYLDIDFQSMPDQSVIEIPICTEENVNISIPTTVQDIAEEVTPHTENLPQSESQATEVTIESQTAEIENAPQEAETVTEISVNDKVVADGDIQAESNIQNEPIQEQFTMKNATEKKLEGDVSKDEVRDQKDSESEEKEKNVGESSKVTSSGISLRRRSSRRCRWHDNDSVCERCDTTFVRKIAFGRKPKRSKDSPRSSVDDGSLNLPIAENYHEGIEDDALTLTPSLATTAVAK